MRAYQQVEFGGTGASGSKPRRLSHAAVMYSIFAVLAVSNIFTLGALFMAPEISALFDGQEDQAHSAYQERILQLRMEVDRLHSRQYRQDGDLNLQMQELTQQQEFLSEQHRYVRILAEKAEALGLSPDSMDVASVDELPVVITGSIAAPFDEVTGIGVISQSIDSMLSESRMALNAISDAAENSTGEIVDGLGSVGIRLSVNIDESTGTGGPFIAAADAFDENSLAESANGVLEALDRFEQARDGLNAAPIHYPFAAQFRLSSNFGTRRDPIRGTAAFHSGMDFAAPTGTSVLAAGSGRIVYAGTRSGYGKVVEIDHGDGIISRYAHLSAILVRMGQIVDTGDAVARVGSTGRSTGPHLHFEIRRNDTPQNPARFIALGKQLSAYKG